MKKDQQGFTPIERRAGGVPDGHPHLYAMRKARMAKKLSVVMLLSGALCAPSMVSALDVIRDWPALTKDGKMVVPYAADGATAGTINFKYNVFTLGTNTLLKATTPRLMTLPKDETTLCGTTTYSNDDQNITVFGTRPGYVYTAKANYVECEGPTGEKEDHRSYFYSANISTGASCVYAARMKPTPTATTYTTNVELISANEIASQNGDAIKDVMITMWTPVSTYLGSVIIDPATCTELKSNSYSVGTL